MERLDTLKMENKLSQDSRLKTRDSRQDKTSQVESRNRSKRKRREREEVCLYFIRMCNVYLYVYVYVFVLLAGEKFVTCFFHKSR